MKNISIASVVNAARVAVWAGIVVLTPVVGLIWFFGGGVLGNGMERIIASAMFAAFTIGLYVTARGVTFLCDYVLAFVTPDGKPGNFLPDDQKQPARKVACRN